MKNRLTALILTIIASVQLFSCNINIVNTTETEYLTESEAAARPFYEQLSDDEKAVYTALYRGISECRTSIELPFKISGDTYDKIYNMVCYQEGELAGLGDTYSLSSVMSEAEITYTDEPKLKNERTVQAACEIAENMPTELTDFEKALYIHDAVAESCVYTYGENSSSAYGCLVDGEAVCLGYAQAFNIIARDAGMQCVVVTGTGDGESHAWNQIKIDGEWYNVDVAWDDSKHDAVDYFYFLRSDEEFCQSHIADNQYGEAFDCTVEDNIYYKNVGKFAESIEDAEEIILRNVENGITTIEIKFADSELYGEFKGRYLSENGEMFDFLEGVGVEITQVGITEYVSENYMILTL